MKKATLISSVIILTFLMLSFGACAEEPLVSTVFFESDVRDAINELVFQTGINIIMDETVRGVITLDLRDVPLEKALTMLSLAGGFSFTKIDDFYFVGIADPKNPSFRHLVETESVRLQYISQSEARNLLPSIYDSYLRSSSERDIISITAPRALIAQFKEDLLALDRPAKQVLIQAIVTEISQAALQEYGLNLLDFSKQDGPGGLGSEADWKGIHLSSDLGESFDVAFRSKFFSYGDLLAQLKILESENKAEIKANPRVLVSDRAVVNLFSGQTQHIILSDSSSSSSSYLRKEAVDVGVSLQVSPRILNDQELEIVISPEISHFINDHYNGKTGFSVRRNEVSTSVYVQNGQTLVIAGMTLDQELEHRSQVPLLGSIPIVRWLFSNNVAELEARELVVFLVAEIQ